MTEKFIFGKIEQTLVDKAINFATQKHAGHLDDDGLDYFSAHLWHVSRIIDTATGGDEEMVAAALLHDTIEDTSTTYEELKEHFGKRIADLVHEVTHEGKKDEYGRYFPRLKTRDGIVLKLADRMSNLLRMDSWPEKRKEQYLRKTKFWKDGSDL